MKQVNPGLRRLYLLRTSTRLTPLASVVEKGLVVIESARAIADDDTWFWSGSRDYEDERFADVWRRFGGYGIACGIDDICIMLLGFLGNGKAEDVF